MLFPKFAFTLLKMFFRNMLAEKSNSALHISVQVMVFSFLPDVYDRAPTNPEGKSVFREM